jgi:hypothetical protein
MKIAIGRNICDESQLNRAIYLITVGGMSYRPSRRHVLALVPGLAVAAVAASPASAAGTGGSFAIRDVRIFDGRRVTERGSVLVADGRIVATGALPLPSHHQVYDGRGMTLLPGLIDCHVHSFEGSRADALRFGVTTELDMFGDPSLLADARRQRRSTAKTDQADLWSSGIGVTVPGGHPLVPDWDFPRAPTGWYTSFGTPRPGLRTLTRSAAAAPSSYRPSPSSTGESVPRNCSPTTGWSPGSAELSDTCSNRRRRTGRADPTS